MQIIAHRGIHGENARENTPWAFTKALVLNFQMIELDARLTRDGKLIVHHDEVISCQGRRVKFENESLEDLIADRICTENGIGADRHKIPSLELVLEMFLPEMRINVELKEKRLAKVFIQLLKEMVGKYPKFHSGEILKKLLVSSFLENEIFMIKESFPQMETALLVKTFQFPISSSTRITIAHLKGLGVEGVHIPRQKVGKDLVDYLKLKEFKVRVYTVNDEISLFKCINLGVDAIFTDKPEILTCLKAKSISKQVFA